MSDSHLDEMAGAAPVRELTKRQRRVLGTLLEKAFTTPEYYPLTLKALTAGCNQKSNRDPVTNYNEDQVLETLDELRGLGLAAVIHTESGRTERYRHYMRQRYTFSEPQLAVVTELLLRGRQAPGELRSRAGRMVAIDSLDALRDALQRLADEGYVQASGPLERRGVEIDHGFYPPDEARAAPAFTPSPAVGAPAATSGPTPAVHDASSSSAWQTQLIDLAAGYREVREEVRDLRDRFDRMSDEFDRLRRELGG